jgi:hypothetical protein
MLNGNPEIPEGESWGGSFVKVSSRPKTIFMKNAIKEDAVEVFEVMEIVFDGPDLGETHDKPVFMLEVKGQEFEGFYCGDGKYKVRFMPKSLGYWRYVIKSDISELDGQCGEFTCIEETKERRYSEISRYPNWWSDKLDEKLAEGEHKGAKTVNIWREQFLLDFQKRFDRCLK